MKWLCSMAAMGLLAGCGSSGGQTSEDRALDAAELEDTLAQENISNPAALPSNGTADYRGFMTLALPIGGAATDYVGDLDMVVDFGAPRNQVSGSVGNFDGLTGELSIGGGDVDRGTDVDVDFTFDGGLTGTLMQGADGYAVDGNIVGEFRGRNQDGLTGLVYGDIDGPDGQDLFQGSMAATRNEN